MMCAQGQLHVNIYQIVLTLSLYVITGSIYDFVSLHSLGNCNVFVSSSSQNTVILKIMFVSLLCLMLDLLTECYYYDHHQVVQINYYQFVIFMNMLPH